MKLQPCPKLKCGKADTPRNTVARLEALLKPRAAYTYVEHNVAPHLYWSAVLVDELDFRAMGKGTSRLLCKAGALAEAAEWLTRLQTVDLPGYTAAHQDELEDPVRIEELLAHVATATPEVVARIKQSNGARHWVDGVSLLDGRTRKVPIEYVHRISGPNGLAAGNRVEEALEHALCEVFERRAQITVLKQRMVMPTIDLESITHPIVRQYIRFLREREIEIRVKDLSFGGELPCVGVYFADPHVPETFQFHHFFKVGAAFDREEALLRCFTEYTQGRRTDEFLEGSRPADLDRLLAADFRRLPCIPADGDNYLSAFMFGMVPFAAAGFLRRGPVVPMTKGEPADDFLVDIQKALDLFRKLGKDCLVVDCTDPEAGFPVVEAIVPGYSDVLPYYPPSSTVLFRDTTRTAVLESYAKNRLTKQGDRR